jgi:tRNA(Ile)-lysidine synthetase-like protein
MGNVVIHLLEQVRDALEQIDHPVERPMIAALSGGVDSQVLVHALCRILAESGHRLLAVHIDHGLRDESADDARRVLRLCKEWDIACQLEQVDVPAWDSRLRQGTESAARHARYASLARIAQEHKSDVILTGHTLDDQLETVLLRLLSGAGLEGLSGMTMVSDRSIPLQPEGETSAHVRIVRPLLSSSRADVEAYAEEVKIEAIEDPSNTDLGFRRNAIRHTVIPQLESVEPTVRSAVARTTELLQDDVRFIAEVVDDAFDRVVVQRGGLWMLDRRRFRTFHPAIQRRLLLRMFERIVSISLRLGRERIDALRHAAVDGQPGKIIEIVDELVAYTDYDRIAIGRSSTIEDELRRLSWVPLLEPGSEIPLNGEVDVPLLNGWRVRGQAPCDGEFLLRTRRDGDRTRGKRGQEVKLQDWLVNHKVPRYLRDWLPVVALENEIRWVIGLDMTELPDARNRIHLHLERDVPGSGSDHFTED